MPVLSTVADMVLAEFQKAFVASPWTPERWQITVGEEVAADIDAFTDQCCKGLGVVLISDGAMEVRTSQQQDGSLYMRITIHLMVFRCAPVMGNDGRVPKPEEHLLYTRKVLDDAERMMRAVWGVSEFDWITEQDISDPTWQAIPVDGGCGGGVVSFEMAVIGDCPELPL